MWKFPGSSFKMISVASDTKELKELIGSKYIGIGAQLKPNSAQNSIILAMSDGRHTFLIDLKMLEGNKELEWFLS